MIAAHKSPAIAAKPVDAGFATSIEAADFLRVSKSLVNKLIAEGRIPARRYGRSVRISWTWLRQQAEAD